jgi:hypothetical protein
MATVVKLLGRGFAVFGFIVCLQTLNAGCSSRLTPAEAPVAPASERLPEPTTTAPTPEPPPPPPPAATAVDPTARPGECAVIVEPGEPIATVALSDPITASNAPRPSNDSERLLFRQLYETLVRVDCHGRIGPGLAASWQLAGDRLTWLVTLRDGASFSDGTPVTAADVRAGWTRHDSGDELLPRVSRLIQSIALVNERSLAITLRHHRVDLPVALAHPDLAIAKTLPDSAWPLGTRSRSIAAEGDPQAPRAATVTAVAPDDPSAIRFLVSSGDVRDFLDDGVDLLLTRDASALDYAATLPQFQTVPLAWRRTYALLTPGGSRSSPSLSEDARQVLADDAVRGEARGARGPLWWQALPACQTASSPARVQSSPTPRIVYDARDPAARDLAERFVGLVRASSAAPTRLLDALLPDRPSRRYERATGLTGETLASAQRRGTDAGYVMSLDSRPIDPCRDLQALMDRAPWLDPDTIVPLVETRLRAIVRRGRSGLTAEWDGGLLVAGLRPAR